MGGPRRRTLTGLFWREKVTLLACQRMSVVPVKPIDSDFFFNNHTVLNHVLHEHACSEKCWSKFRFFFAASHGSRECLVRR